MTIRTAVRTGVVLAGASLAMVPSAPVLAASQRDAGDEPGESLSTLAALGLFVGVPLAVFFGIWLLVLLPGSVRGPRYRPHLGWRAEPVWFGGPADPEQAVATTAAGQEERGGARAQW